MDEIAASLTKLSDGELLSRAFEQSANGHIDEVAGIMTILGERKAELQNLRLLRGVLQFHSNQIVRALVTLQDEVTRYPQNEGAVQFLTELTNRFIDDTKKIIEADPTPLPIGAVVIAGSDSEVLLTTLRSLLYQAYPNVTITILSTEENRGVVSTTLARFTELKADVKVVPSIRKALTREFFAQLPEIQCVIPPNSIMHDSALWRMADLFARHAEVKLVFSQRFYYDVLGMVTPFTFSQICLDINDLEDHRITQPPTRMPSFVGTFWRREVAMSVPAGFHPTSKHVYDAELILKWAKYSTPLAYLFPTVGLEVQPGDPPPDLVNDLENATELSLLMTGSKRSQRSQASAFQKRIATYASATTTKEFYRFPGVILPERVKTSLMADPPTITVIADINARATQPQIRRLFDSINSQLWPSLEFGLALNGRPPHLSSELNRFAHLSPQISTQEDVQDSISLCLNDLILRTNGSLLVFLNERTWLAPQALWMFAAVCRALPTAHAITCRTSCVTSKGLIRAESGPQLDTRSALRRRLTRDLVHSCCPLFVTRKALSELEYWFDPAYHEAFDIDLALRVMRNHPAHYLHAPLLLTEDPVGQDDYQRRIRRSFEVVSIHRLERALFPYTAEILIAAPDRDLDNVRFVQDAV